MHKVRYININKSTRQEKENILFSWVFILRRVQQLIGMLWKKVYFTFMGIIKSMS